MLKRIRNAIAAFRRPPTSEPSKRSYPAAQFDRLTQDWTPSTSTGDGEIRFDICSLRARSRQLERADPLAKRGYSCLEKNVLKSGVGFSFQSKVLNPNGTPDFLANQKIEKAWKKWCKPVNCTENGEESFADVCRLFLRSTGRDGGVMARKIIDPNANEFGFTLRPIEIDHLDINYTTILGNGNRVIMGVEKDGRGRTLAYHLLTDHPGDTLFGFSPRHRVRIPADEIIHYFVKERLTQCVGVPWFAPSMIRMHHLEQYEIAEIVASRAAANKGGYFTSATGQPYAGDKEEVTGPNGTEETGATLAESEPGQYDELPPGMTFTPYDPTHPTQQFGDFCRDARLSIAAGMDISYATLTGDLKNASFSSMRTGWLDERETYMKMQAHMIEHFVIPVFEAWLEMALTTGALNLPFSKFDQFNEPNFRGRRWPWVDPLKDVQAKIEEVKNGLTTRDAIIDESDSELDLEETFAQLEYEKELAEEKGLVFGDAPPEQMPATEPPEETQPEVNIPRMHTNGHAKKLLPS